jgi:hypothetical protein
MAHGGSLTINPETGLPEAGFLSRILPTLLGVGLAATGVGAPLAAGLVGLGTTALTGDINKGLMAGLGAFGGAGMAGAAGLGGSIAGGNAFGVLGDAPGLLGAEMGAGIAAETAAQAAQIGAGSINNIPTFGQVAAEQATQGLPLGAGGINNIPTFGQAAVGAPTLPTLPTAAPTTLGQIATGPIAAPASMASDFVAAGALPSAATTTAPAAAPGFLSRFGDYTSIPGAPKMVNTVLPYAAAYGAIAPALTPTGTGFPEEEEQDYTVPQYRLRSVSPRIPEGNAYDRENYRGEYQFFDPSGFQRMAEGDEVPAPAAGGLGSLGASLPEYVKMFQTSPGAVTGVPYGYGPGQSPMDLIRADIAAKAAAKATATPDAPVSAIAPPSALRPIMGGEADYGFMKNAPRANPMSLYGDEYGGFSSGYGGYPAGGFDYTRMMGGYAKGGTIEMESGGFVMPARETAEFGNGSTDAGQRQLAAMGGMPINGRGDGVSDSIPARIDGSQQARLANGETYFPPRAVERMGGADKLRAMMNKATQSRRQAARGGDNKLRGLA